MEDHNACQRLQPEANRFIPSVIKIFVSLLSIRHGNREHGSVRFAKLSPKRNMEPIIMFG